MTDFVMTKWRSFYVSKSIYIYIAVAVRDIAPTNETLYLLYKHFPFTLAEMFENAIGEDRTRNNTENLNSRRKFLKYTLPHNNAYKVQ